MLGPGDSIEALVMRVPSPERLESAAPRLASQGGTTYVVVGAGAMVNGLAHATGREAAVRRVGVSGGLSVLEPLLKV